ncbi:MAG: hypothetical protein HUK24_09065 [Sphaerochaetaceae bacterium]|nr:hypothetical protein [Sphaerochaetaceae bacterium]
MNTYNLREAVTHLDHTDNSSLGKEQSQALVIDLSTEKTFALDIPSAYLQSYISGPALGARLWADFAEEGANDPSVYENDNPIIITTSYFTNGSMPGGELVSITFRSPVTGLLCFNTFPSTFGMRLSALGFDALILIGRAHRPSLIKILRSKVGFEVSEAYTGFSTSKMEEYLNSSNMTCVMSIGPAGENKVPFASVVCEGKTTGRGGLGCVFGFKNIKAISITGFSMENSLCGPKEDVKKVFSEIVSSVEKCSTTLALRKYGSPWFIKNAGKKGWAPVENFNKRTDPRLFHLNGEEIGRRFGDDHFGCINCPILCRHKTKDGRELPAYDSTLMLGSNLGTYEPLKVLERYEVCLDLGLDPVSTGNILGWAKEAGIIGLVPYFKTIDFTDNNFILPLLKSIADRSGAGESLSHGVKALGQGFNNSSFSYHIRGLECGPFDYRGAFAQSVSSVMGFDIPNFFEMSFDLVKKNVGDWTVFNENLVLGLQSFGIIPDLIIPTIIEPIKLKKIKQNIIPNSALNKIKGESLVNMMATASGRDIQMKDIINVGERTWCLVYTINKELGVHMLEDSVDVLPIHFAMDPDSNHKERTIVPIRALLDRYCLLRQYSIVSKIN